jgi:hypothetical protein
MLDMGAPDQANASIYTFRAYYSRTTGELVAAAAL